ncbi:MAG TPA: NAD-dependent epimerase/dehydratase family protein [Polyangia bacterium]|nr:NAD-dependent epimerase/dehydratase family protein [Polyangia bacterium]
MRAAEPHVLVLGGTGFLGRPLAAALLDRGFSATMTGRRPPRHLLGRQSAFLAPHDLASPDFDPAALLAPLFERPLVAVINLVSRTSGDRAAVWRDSFDSVRGVLATIDAARARWPSVRLVHVGSIAEHGRAPFQSAYGRAKRAARQALQASGHCDVHALVGIVGGDNPRLVRDLERFDGIVARSPLLLDGFRLPYLCVDEAARQLAEVVRHAVERDAPRGPTVEVRLEHRWLTLRELRRECLGRSDVGGARRLDRVRLCGRELVERWRARRDGSRRRLALFCRLARLSGHPDQARWNHYALLSPER